MKLVRAIAIALLIALLAVGARADQGNGGGNGNGNGNGNGDGNSQGDDHGNGNGTRGNPGGPNGKEKRSARSKDGTYNLNISGFFKGTGTATVSATTVSLTGQATPEGGSPVSLSVISLQLSGPYFSGSGTIGNIKVDIKGKLDAAKISRLTATYKTSDSHFGRIAGTIPGEQPDGKFDDNGNQH